MFSGRLEVEIWIKSFCFCDSNSTQSHFLIFQDTKTIWTRLVTSGYSLGLGVEDVSRPAVHEARVSCEPQHHHEDEQRQDADLCVTHRAQTAILVSDHLGRCSLLLRLNRPAAPRLPQAATHENQSLPFNICILKYRYTVNMVALRIKTQQHLTEHSNIWKNTIICI